MVFPRAKPGCEGFIQTGVFYQFIGALQQPSPLKGKRLTMICASLCSFKSCSLCTPEALCHFSLTSMVTRGIIFPISKKAMTRRVGLLKWQRELRVVKAVQEGRLKMDLEPPGRMVKPAGTARYSSRVFMALSGVPVKSFSGDGGEKKSGNTVIHRLSISRDDFFYFNIISGRFFI